MDLAMEPAMSSPDRELIDRFVAERDADAFDELVRRHRDRVFRLAVSVLGPGSDGEAEEVTQEAFIRAFEHLDRFRHQSRFSTWLFRVTFRLAVDRRRTPRWAKPHVPEEVLSSQASADVSPAVAAMARHRRDEVRQAVEELPDHLRSAVHLHYWLGFSIEDAAATLGVAPGTIKAQLFRARKRLAETLPQRSPST